MKENKIINVYNIFYCSPEEIAGCDNGNVILNECAGMDKIPVRLLKFRRDHDDENFILVAGEGATYPWKRGQRVELSGVNALISTLGYLRDMKKVGIDNTKYQHIWLHDKITLINDGRLLPEKDAKSYMGLVSYDFFKEVGDAFND